MKLNTGTYKLKMILDTLPARNRDERRARSKFLKENNLTDDSPFIRKGYIPGFDSVPGDDAQQFNDGERSRIVQITTGALDRDGEVVRPDGANLMQYAKNPVVLFAHKYDMMPVGRAAWIKANEKGLIAKTMYNKTKLADDIYENAKLGFPLAVSVGFVPVEMYRAGQKGFSEQISDCIGKGWLNQEDAQKVKTIYSKWIMLEYSDVPVPSNPEAIQLAISKGWIEAEDKSLAVMKPEPEETENEIRIRIKDPALFEDGSFRRIAIKEDKPRVFAIIGRLKGEEKTTIQAYRFPKEDGWTIESASKWVEEHKAMEDDLMNNKQVEDVKEKTIDMDGNISVMEIYECICEAGMKRFGMSDWHIDDIFPIDYPNGHVVICHEEKHMDYEYSFDEDMEHVSFGEAVEVVEAYRMKGFGSIVKEGRVLSGKNRNAVIAAIEALQSLLAAADEGKSAKKDMDTNDGGRIFKMNVSSAIPTKHGDSAKIQTPQSGHLFLTDEQVLMLKSALENNIKNIFSGERENLLKLVSKRIACATGRIDYE